MKYLSPSYATLMDCCRRLTQRRSGHVFDITDPRRERAMHSSVRSALLSLALALVLLSVAPPANATTVERVVSPGGIEAWLVRDHLNPIINVRFAFLGGAALDPDGKEGLASMISALLDEGAGDLDSNAFRQKLNDLSITLRFDAARDRLGGQLRALTEHRDTAFGLLAQAMTKPRFDSEPIERLRAQILSKLRRDEENPRAVASRAMMETLFNGHAYSRPTDGTQASVANLSKADMQRFVADRLALDNLKIGITGDITPEQLAPLLDSTFGGLPKKASAWSIPTAEPHAQGQVIVIDKPIRQSNIMFADAGIKREDPDFYAAFVMNHILGGGGFTSRLYDEVREKRGLAYSVYSYMHPMKASALFLGGAGTANARVSETLKVVRDEWKKLADNGVTVEELANAQSFLIGSFPLRFTSSDRIASMLVGMQVDNLGLDYLDRRNTHIAKVTSEDITRVARKLLRPEHMIFVIVGQPEGVTATK